MFSRDGFHRRQPPAVQAPVRRASFPVLLLSGLLLLPGTLLAAEEPAEEQLPFGAEEEVDPEPYADLPDTHAGREASPELMRLASQQPEQFVDKMAIFEDGTIIGPVMNVRRHLDDKDLYLIIDATAFFNNPTEYAVPAQDMVRVQGDLLVIAEFTGMHLRGRQYYEEDYVDTGFVLLEDDSAEDD